MSKDDEVIHHGPITEYRPHKDDVSGGRDKSVQTEAKGAEGISDLQSSGSTSGGAAGTVSSPDDQSRPAGNREKPTR